MVLKLFQVFVVMVFVANAASVFSQQTSKSSAKQDQRSIAINLPGFAKSLSFGMTKEEVKKATPVKLRENDDGGLYFAIFESGDFKKMLKQTVNYGLHFHFDKEGLLNKIEMHCGLTDGCDKKQKLSGFWEKLEKKFGKVKPKTKHRTSEFTWVKNSIVWKYYYYYGEESGDVIESYVIFPE